MNPEQRHTHTEQRNIEAVYRVERMSDDIVEIKSIIKEMALAIAKLALVEERQAQDRADLGRAFKNIDSHDGRIRTLENAQPLQQQATDWVGKGLWLVVGGVMSAVLSFFLVAMPPYNKPSQYTPSVTTGQQK